MGPEWFTKKPVAVQAMQWDGTAEGATPITNWILNNGGIAVYHCSVEGNPECPSIVGHAVRRYCPDCSYSNLDPEITISTLEGTMATSPNDWVIRGVKGEFYPCKPDIFTETYNSNKTLGE